MSSESKVRSHYANDPRGLHEAIDAYFKAMFHQKMSARRRGQPEPSIKQWDWIWLNLIQPKLNMRCVLNNAAETTTEPEESSTASKVAEEASAAVGGEEKEEEEKESEEETKTKDVDGLAGLFLAGGAGYVLGQASQPRQPQVVVVQQPPPPIQMRKADSAGLLLLTALGSLAVGGAIGAGIASHHHHHHHVYYDDYTGRFYAVDMRSVDGIMDTLRSKFTGDDEKKKKKKEKAKKKKEKKKAKEKEKMRDASSFGGGGDALVAITPYDRGAELAIGKSMPNEAIVAACRSGLSKIICQMKKATLAYDQELAMMAYAVSRENRKRLEGDFSAQKLLAKQDAHRIAHDLQMTDASESAWTNVLNKNGLMVKSEIKYQGETEGGLAIPTERGIAMLHLHMVHPQKDGMMPLYARVDSIASNDSVWRLARFVYVPRPTLPHSDFFMNGDIGVPFKLYLPATGLATGEGHAHVRATVSLVKAGGDARQRAVYSMGIPSRKIRIPGARAANVMFEFEQGNLHRVALFVAYYTPQDNLALTGARGSSSSNIRQPSSWSTMGKAVPSGGTAYVPSKHLVQYGGVRDFESLELLRNASHGDGLPLGFPPVKFKTIAQSCAELEEFAHVQGVLSDIKSRLKGALAIGLARDLIKSNQPVDLKPWSSIERDLSRSPGLFKLPQDRVTDYLHVGIDVTQGTLGTEQSPRYVRVGGVVSRTYVTVLDNLAKSIVGIKTRENPSVNVYSVENSGGLYVLHIPADAHGAIPISKFFRQYDKKKKDGKLFDQKYRRSMMISVQIGKDERMTEALKGCPRTFTITFHTLSQLAKSELTSSQTTYHAEELPVGRNTSFKSNRTQQESALVIVERQPDENLGMVGSIYIIYRKNVDAGVKDEDD